MDKEISEEETDEINEEERKRILKENKKKKRQKEENERKRKQKEEEEIRRKEEEERRRKLKEEEEEEMRRQIEERKRQEEEEEEMRRQEEEEEEMRRQIEERRRQEEEEEEKKRQEEEEEERIRQEEEEEEMRRQIEERRRQEEENKRKRKEEEENNENFITTFLPISLYEYSQTINTYSQHISPFQYQVFQITSPINFSQFLTGNNPKLLLNSPETNPNYLSGLCSLSYITYTNELGLPQTHLFINHLSTHERAWKKQIKTMISFIKANFDFSILSLTLFDSLDYPNQHQEILDLFTKDLSFTELSNPEQSEPITLSFSNEYHIANPLISPVPHSFNFNLMSILSLSSSQPESVQYNYDKYINTFAIKAIIFKLFNEQKLELNQSVSTIKWDKSIISSMSSLMNNFKFNIDNHSLPLEMNDTFKFDYKTLTLHKNAINHSLQISCKFSFENLLTIKYNDYIYNRISTQVTTYKDINTNSSIYKLSTMQNDYSILIMELNNQLKETFLYNGHNIYETFNNWFNSLNEELTSKEEIYIPSFELTAHTDANEIEAFPDNMMTLNNNELYINTIDEYFHIQIVYDSSYRQGFTLLPNENTGDIVIKDAYMIGIMNSSIYTEYNIPCIHLSIISKDKWAVCSN